MTNREIAVLVTLVVYKIVLVVIGLAAQRRTSSAPADFYLAGRRMGPIVASISASASSSSAWTLLGVSGMAYASGLSAIWLFPACVGGFCLNWFVLAPKLQKLSHASGAVTATDIIAGGRAALAKLASVIILGSLLTYVASQFQAAGKSFSATFGMSQEWSIGIGSAIVVVYTLLGGFWAVSVTDTLQGIVMALTSIILPVVALASVGFSGLVDGLNAVDVEGFTSVFGARAAIPAGVGFALGLLGIGLGYPGQPHVVNRFMALRDDGDAIVIARRTAILWAVVVYSGMILLGWCARVLFPALDDGETAFMRAANELFHPVLAGIMVAAVLSAVMSTADSQLLVAASSVTHDLGLRGPFSHPRFVVLLISAGAVAAALIGDESIFDRVLFAWSAIGCAFGPLLLVIALRGPVRVTHTSLSMLVGAGLSIASYYLKGATLFGFANPVSLGAWGGVCERVVPFFVALAIAWSGSTRERER